MAKSLVIFSFFLIIFLAIFSSGILKPLGHDENMYCTAGALMANGQMVYRDFSYVTHPPYHPILLAAVYRILNTNHYLLVGRLISIICDCLVVAIMFLIYIQAFGNNKLAGFFTGLAAATIYTLNPFVNYAGGFAWNHSVILFCTVASYWLYTSIDNRKCLCVAAIAVLLTFATFSRITSALIWIIFFIFIWFAPNQSASPKFKSIGTYLLSTLIVSLLPLYIIAQAPKAFYLDVIINPLLNGQYLHKIGTTFSKPQMILSVLTEPIYAMTILISICAWVIFWVHPNQLIKTHKINMMLASSLVIVSVIIALVPLTVWQQYFAMPALFLLISCAYPLKFAAGNHSKFVGVTASAIIALSIFLNPWPFAEIPSAFSVPNWVPMRVHLISNDIAQKVGRGNRVLTLAPIFAIEGDCKIYQELSAGPFAYRVADLMSPADRIIAKVAGPAEIAQLVQKNLPSAILVGTEPKPLEEALRKIALQDWKTQEYLGGQLTLLYGP